MTTLLMQFLHYLRVECGYSNHTLIAYQRDLQSFLAFHPERSFSQAHRLFMDTLLSRGLKPRTMARKQAAIKHFYSFCAQEDPASISDPIHSQYRIKMLQRIPRALSKEAVDRLVSAPTVSTYKGRRDRVILELLYSTGMRVSECVQLPVSAVDLVSNQLKVIGKGARHRTIGLTHRLHTYLQCYLSDRDGLLLTSHLFVTQKGRPLTRHVVYTMVKQYAVQCGLNPEHVSPHSMRHSFATHLLDGGARIRDVQLLLGHQSLASTQIYTTLPTASIKRHYMQAHPRAST